MSREYWKRPKNMEVRATQKYILTSPKKIREVASLVKRLTPGQALERLPFIRKGSARELQKVIAVAIANAKQQGEANIDNLVFKEILVNEGPRLKRWRAGARGRAKPYKKRMSHIRVVLKTRETKPVKEAKTESKEVLPKDKKTEIDTKKPSTKENNKSEKSINK